MKKSLQRLEKAVRRLSVGAEGMPRRQISLLTGRRAPAPDEVQYRNRVRMQQVVAPLYARYEVEHSRARGHNRAATRAGSRGDFGTAIAAHERGRAASLRMQAAGRPWRRAKRAAEEFLGSNAGFAFGEANPAQTYTRALRQEPHTGERWFRRRGHRIIRRG
jgi:hypothetical protein